MGTGKYLVIASPLMFLAGFCGSALLRAAEEPRDPDEAFLLAAKISVDDKSLIQFLEKHSPTDLDPQNVDGLVRNLGAPSFENREKATKDLLRMGLPALASLREALREPDAEVRRRAEQCVEKIERDATWRLHPPAVRLLVKRKAQGATEALLRFLPYAVGESLQEEIWYGLAALVLKDGAVRPAIIAALKDASPVRRAVAACIVGRLGDAQQKDVVRKLLADPDPTVRLRAAQGLLAAREKAGIPVLVDLLAVPSTEVAWQAEELLHWVAGERAPNAAVGAKNGPGCREAWRKWWDARQSDLDLAVVEKRPSRPGLFFLCEWGNGGVDPLRLWTCGCDGIPRWELPIPQSFAWGDLLPNSRLLIQDRTNVKKNGIREDGPLVFSERTLTGETIRSAKAPYSTRYGAPRVLPDGSLLVIHRRALKYVACQFSPFEKVIFSRELAVPYDQTKFAHVAANGNIICTFQEADRLFLSELDPWGGTETAKTEIDGGRQVLFALEPLAEARYLVLDVHGKRVCELDRKGRRGWHIDVPQALAATRLRDGNTLVLCYEPERFLCEITRNGKTVWEAVPENSHHLLQGRPCLTLVRFGFEKKADHADMNVVEYRRSALRSRRAAIRRRAASVLPDLGPGAEITIPDLIETFLDPDAAVRNQAAASLTRFGENGVAALVGALQDKRGVIRLEAAAVLAGIPAHKGKTMPVLKEALSDHRPEVRRKSAEILGRLGPEARSAVPQLQALLTEQDPPTRREAAETLGEIGPFAERAVPDLVGAIKLDDEELRVRCISALGRIAPKDERVKTAILAALHDKDFLAVRAVAARVIYQRDIKPKEAIPSLIENLGLKGKGDLDALMQLRWETIVALGAFGKEAEASVPALIDVLKQRDLDDSAREMAVDALARIGRGAKAAIPTVINIFKSEDEPLLLRKNCAKALGHWGRDAAAVVPDLVKALQNANPIIRSAAAKALESIENHEGRKHD